MDDRELIDRAIAEGRLRKIPAGVSGREIKATKQSESRTRFRPEHCGAGRQRLARPHLDQLDGDWS